MFILMKGVTEVVSTILMLLVTLGLASLAYLFISGTFTQQTQGIELVDAYCVNGTVTMLLRNIGDAAIFSVICRQIVPSEDMGTPCTSTASSIPLVIQPGTTNMITDICSGSGERYCIYRIIPPVGRTIVVQTSCI